MGGVGKAVARRSGYGKDGSGSGSGDERSLFEEFPRDSGRRQDAGGCRDEGRGNVVGRGYHLYRESTRTRIAETGSFDRGQSAVI